MRNRILKFLPAQDFAKLEPHLTAVDLPARLIVQEPDLPVEFSYFIEEGLASVLTFAGTDKIEVGVIGAEGLTGLAPILDVERTPYQVIMQIGGSGWRVAAADLRRVMEDAPALAKALRQFAHVQNVQSSQTALANGRCTVEQRLARWLLMAHDRLRSDEIGLTHDFLAIMLGVRRPGVTVALHVLEGTRAIRARRSSIRVVDRDKLKSIAGAFYGVTEAAYEDIFRIELQDA